MLDLSYNNLSGKIPKELVILQILNLSFDQLEGDVPMLINASIVSVAENSKLCGGNQEFQLKPCFHQKIRNFFLKKIYHCDPSKRSCICFIVCFLMRILWMP